MAATPAASEPAKLNFWEARKKEQESRLSSAGFIAVTQVHVVFRLMACVDYDNWVGIRPPARAEILRPGPAHWARPGPFAL